VPFVKIPAGSFWMGSEDGLPDARPRRRVWVDGFAIAPRPVTTAEYDTYLLATGTPPPRFWADPRFSDPQQPVVGVSWAEAVAFCDWLTRETGDPHRLPTEAEWERAARGDLEGARYAWGDESPARWFGLAGRALAAPPTVGAGPVNGFGLTDLAGAVHEWCRDWYAGDTYARAPDRNPTGPPSGTRRVSRGGAWRHQDPWSPVAHRSSLPPHLRYSDYGFRVVRGWPPIDASAGREDPPRERGGRQGPSP
jgi:sulfatase modifying factor 1